MTDTLSSDRNPLLPGDGDIVVHFAHPAYRLAQCFARRDIPISHFQTENRADTLARLGEGHVLVLSGLWSNDMLEAAANLRYIQVCAAGYDQFDREALRAKGVRLANGSGVNRNAVSDHAMAMILAFARQIHSARDRQRERLWRPMISSIDRREEELEGKRILIYGLGTIGSRLARLARAFGMYAIGIKRNIADHDGSADEVKSPADFLATLAEVDIVVLTCPLTPETEGLVDAAALARMKPTAYLVNVARGPCVDEAALADALQAKTIAGAGIDTFASEPLPADSVLWGLENALITPHSAGETRRYEENVIDILLTNLRRLQRGEEDLVNRIV